MVNKIRAVVEARSDPQFVIIARTDSVHTEGLDGAIDRAKAYVAAGADATMFHGLNQDDLERAAKASGAPASR